MPNHVHLLIKPLIPLATMMNIFKGTSAKEINNIMDRKGTFWAKTYYDKAIRDQKHFDVVYNYIKNNPSKLIDTNTRTPRFYGICEE
jgi:putative transposase